VDQVAKQIANLLRNSLNLHETKTAARELMEWGVTGEDERYTCMQHTLPISSKSILVTVNAQNSSFII
jgi:putative IMPACT (imprinted ancient) family translation regulator